MRSSAAAWSPTSKAPARTRGCRSTSTMPAASGWCWRMPTCSRHEPRHTAKSMLLQSRACSADFRQKAAEQARLYKCGLAGIDRAITGTRMIFSDRLMFIHIGKTGGSSCADYLLYNLQGPAYNCHADADLELAPLGIDGMHPRTDIKRHCTLPEALAYVHAF